MLGWSTSLNKASSRFWDEGEGEGRGRSRGKREKEREERGEDIRGARGDKRALVTVSDVSHK
jgi:hypothetical protein